MTFIQPLTTASFVVNDQFQVTKVSCPGSFEIWKNNPNGQPTHRAELREGDLIVSFYGCDLQNINQLDPLLTDLWPSTGYYEVLVHRPNESARNRGRYDRLHLRFKKLTEFKPGLQWGAKDGSGASDAGDDAQLYEGNTGKIGLRVCDMSICNSRV
jgi:hypothetical protein